jgi:adenylate cyclase class 2
MTRLQREVEIKFSIRDVKALSAQLRRTGFRIKTRRTHELNVLYDLPNGILRRRGEILRVRRYGHKWLLTHKSKSKDARHKSRVEKETEVTDGKSLAQIFEALGFRESFRYEKFRTEWTDGKGHVVVDETPIGNIGEIEGAPGWIDRTATVLGIDRREYSTKSYGEMFQDWKKRTASKAKAMTFAATRHSGKAS